MPGFPWTRISTQASPACRRWLPEPSRSRVMCKGPPDLRLQMPHGPDSDPPLHELASTRLRSCVMAVRRHTRRHIQGATSTAVVVSARPSGMGDAYHAFWASSTKSRRWKFNRNCDAVDLVPPLRTTVYAYAGADRNPAATQHMRCSDARCNADLPLPACRGALNLAGNLLRDQPKTVMGHGVIRPVHARSATEGHGLQIRILYGYVCRMALHYGSGDAMGRTEARNSKPSRAES